MANFACLGARTEDDFTAMLGAASGHETRPWPGADLHTLWRDPSGAALAFHYSDPESINCVTPFFFPETPARPWRVRTAGPARDEECLDCSGADCDVLDAGGELVTRTAVQWLCFRPVENWEATWDLRVVAFAADLALYPDVESFEASPHARMGPDPDSPTWAWNCFLPIGLFGESPRLIDRATAILGGKVTASDRRRNGATGVGFTHLRIESCVGEVDVVTGDLVDPAPGSVAFVQAWLVGVPAE